MKISKIAPTVILATSFVTFFLFAFLFYLYGDFKEALSNTVSFFGGIATLVAAYIGTQLFNDWRIVQSGVNKSEHAKLTLLSLLKVQVTLDHYLSQVEIYSYNYNEDDHKLCELLRIEFKEKYTQFMTEFLLNVKYYEAVYQEKLFTQNEYTLNSSDYYFFAINGTLTRITKRDVTHGESGIECYLSQTRIKKQEFYDNTVNFISKKLTPFIDLESS